MKIEKDPYNQYHWRRDYLYSPACSRCSLASQCEQESVNLISRSGEDNNPARAILVARRIEKETANTIEEIERQAMRMAPQPDKGKSVSDPEKKPDQPPKTIPTGWYDMKPRILDGDVQSSKKIEEEIASLERKLSRERRKLRLINEKSKWLSVEVVTKISGVYLCAFEISIESGEVIRDLNPEKVMIFSELNGESKLSDADKNLSSEILALLEKCGISAQHEDFNESVNHSLTRPVSGNLRRVV